MSDRVLDFLAFRTIPWPLWMPGARSAAEAGFDAAFDQDWDPTQRNPYVLPWRRMHWADQYVEGTQ